MATSRSSNEPVASEVPCVLIVDADRRVRQSLADLLALAGVPVAGAAGSVAEALALVEARRPAILLVDPRLPDLDAGEALLGAVADLDARVRVILMGWSDALESPTLQALAHGYVPKAATPERFVATALAALGREPVR